MINGVFGLSSGDMVTQLTQDGRNIEYRYLVERVIGLKTVLGQMVDMSSSYPQSTRDYFSSAPREMIFLGESDVCLVTKTDYSLEDCIT